MFSTVIYDHNDNSDDNGDNSENSDNSDNGDDSDDSDDSGSMDLPPYSVRRVSLPLVVLVSPLISFI